MGTESKIKKVDAEAMFQEIKKQNYQAPFNSVLVNKESINQLILGYQLKYMENVLETAAEIKLLEENIYDFEQYDKAIQVRAIEMAESARYDPEFYNKTKVPSELFLPIQIWNNILNKNEQARNKSWQVKYFGEQIERLNEFSKEV